MNAPVAYRIKDYADGWILQESLTDSERVIYAEQGNVVQALVPADRIAALEKENVELRKALEPFTQIVAARKAYFDATAAYNARLELVREERGRGNWSMKLDREYEAMSEAQATWHRTVQQLVDAALEGETP